MIRNFECFNLRYILDGSTVLILRYGNLATPFLHKFKLFLNIPYIWVKICDKLILFIFYPVLFQYTSEMTPKVSVNPAQIFAWNPCNNVTKLWNYIVFVIGDLQCPFLHFARHSKKCIFPEIFSQICFQKILSKIFKNIISHFWNLQFEIKKKFPSQTYTKPLGLWSIFPF